MDLEILRYFLQYARSWLADDNNYRFENYSFSVFYCLLCGRLILDM